MSPIIVEYMKATFPADSDAVEIHESNIFADAVGIHDAVVIYDSNYESNISC